MLGNAIQVEGEPPPVSEVFCSLWVSFRISLYLASSILQLTLTKFLINCLRKAFSQHNTANTMFHHEDGVTDDVQDHFMLNIVFLHELKRFHFEPNNLFHGVCSVYFTARVLKKWFVMKINNGSISFCYCSDISQKSS